MEAASTLLGLPPPRRLSHLSPYFSHSLFASTTTTSSRGTSLSVNAEPPADGGKGRSSDEPSPSVSPPSKKPGGSGAGFGGTISDSKKKRRSSVVRRPPVERPSLFPSGKEGPSPEEQQQGASESAFIVTWLGLGIVILVEGIALSASGFLPDEWDKLFVKYLYPSFTPTVVLFVGGSVAYGVIKYLQGEKTQS